VVGYIVEDSVAFTEPVAQCDATIWTVATRVRWPELSFLIGTDGERRGRRLAGLDR
jgi:hypothetical protein